MSSRSSTESFASRQALRAVIDKFEIRSPVEFVFAGETLIDLRNERAPPRSGEDLLIGGIQATLYDRCYAQRVNGQISGANIDANFAQRLAAANRGRERWDRGWMIHQFGPNGQAFVRKGDRERAAMPGSFILDSDSGHGMAPQIGSSVSIRVLSGTFDAQPGYYFAFGETLDELADQLSLTRLYFHCSCDGAVLLVSELTHALNCFQTPFQMKTPAAPTLYGRTDAAVLYFGSRYFPIVARVVGLILGKVSLEPATPLFTKALWPGVGAAVEPSTGESFGSHRCRLAAEGIVDAWRRGEQSTEARFAAIAKRFADVGLDLARPWLGSASVDPFERPQSPRLP